MAPHSFLNTAFRESRKAVSPWRTPAEMEYVNGTPIYDEG
jgi:hypothetical protein